MKTLIFLGITMYPIECLRFRLLYASSLVIFLTGCSVQDSTYPTASNIQPDLSSTQSEITIKSDKIPHFPQSHLTVSALESPLQSEEQFAQFQSRSAYNSDWQYTIQFDTQSWYIEEGKYPGFFRLKHHQLLCHLRLAQGGFGASGIGTKLIGDRTWRLFSDRLSFRILYEQKLVPEYYIIGVWFGDSRDQVASPQEREECQKEAEKVLATFTPLPTPPIEELAPLLFADHHLVNNRWRLSVFIADNQFLDFSSIKPVYIFLGPDNGEIRTVGMLRVVPTGCTVHRFPITASPDYTFQVTEAASPDYAYQSGGPEGRNSDCNELQQAQFHTLLDAIPTLTQYDIKDGMILLSGENSRAMLTLK